MNRIDRRTYLALLAGGSVAIAGCASDEADRTGARTDGSNAQTTSESNSSDVAESADEDEGDDSEVGDESSEAPSRFEVGERIEAGSLQLLVADFDVSQDIVVEPDGDSLEAGDGSAFAVVDFAVQHVGDEGVRPVDEAITIGLRDEDGERYERVDPDVENRETAPVELTESRLAPGEVGRDDLVYDVDDDREGFVLEIESLSEDETDAVDLEADRETTELLEQDVEDVLGFSQGAERGGIEVTVASLEHGNNLGGFMQSDEGHEIVAVGVTVDNGSGRDRTLSSQQVQLKDESGRSYHDTPGVLRALENFDGTTIDDGEQQEGTVAYQIEDGLDELYWIVDFDDWDEDERVVWQLR